MRFRDFHPNVKLRLLMSFFSGLVSNMIFPFMAIYFSERLGPTLAGLNVTLSIVVGVVAALIGGHYADRIGRRKMMIAAELLGFVAYVVIMMVNSPWLQSAWITFFMSLSISLFWGLMHPASDAMLLDVTEPESRKYVYQVQYWGNNLSIALTGMIGALLFKNYLFEMLIAMSILSLATLVLTIALLHETFTPQANNDQAQANSGILQSMILIGKGYVGVLKDSTFMIFTVAGMLITSVEFHLSNYVGVRLEREMINVPFLNGTLDGIGMLGILRTENTLFVVIFTLFMGMLMRRFKERSLLIVGVLMYIIGYGMIAYSNSPWVLIMCMFFATVGEIMKVPVQQAYLGYVIPDHARSSYLAVSGLTFNISMLICGAAVMLTDVLPTMIMAIAIGSIGMVGFFMLLSILPRIQHIRKTILSSSSKGVST